MDRRSRILEMTAPAVAFVLLAGCRAKTASLEATPRRLAIYGTAQGKEISVRALDKKGSPVAEMPPLVWTSSNSKVAEVSSGGHVTPKSPGKTTVTVAAGPITSTVSVEVIDLSKIELAPALLRLIGPAGTTARLELTGKNAAGKPTVVPPVAWIVADPKVAAVAGDGTARSIAAGKTLVTAKAGDLVAESELEVDLRNVSRIDLRPETSILRVGENQKLSVTAFDENGSPIPDAGAQFVASAPDVVRVLGDGTITGLKTGTSLVTATVGSRSAHATILVD